MNITLKYLKYFITAAKVASFSKAAMQLHVSSSSVTTAIDRLEDEFGFSLFIRLPARGLILTTQGKEALIHAQYILDEVEEFENQISGIPSALKGTLQLACFSTFSPYFMPRILSNLHSLYPKLKISVYETDLPTVQELLLSGEIDAFLTYDTPKPPSQISYEKLRSVAPYALISADHPLANKNKLSLRELAEYPMILFNLPSSRSGIMSYFEAQDLHPEVVLRSQSIEGVREYVGEGFGFSVLHLVHPSTVTLNNKGLVCKRISGDDLKELNIIVGSLKDRSNRRPKRVEAFIDECRSLFSSKTVDKYFINTRQKRK